MCLFKRNRKDIFIIDHGIKLKNSELLNGTEFPIPNWISANSYNPYHTFVPGDGWEDRFHSISEMQNELYKQAALKKKPIYIFKLEGVIVPAVTTQDENKFFTECKFLQFKSSTWEDTTV